MSWLWFQFRESAGWVRVEIDWVRLTPRQNRRIAWQGSSLLGTAQVYLGPDAAHPEQYGNLLIYEGSASSRADRCQR